MKTMIAAAFAGLLWIGGSRAEAQSYSPTTYTTSQPAAAPGTYYSPTTYVASQPAAASGPYYVSTTAPYGQFATSRVGTSYVPAYSYYVVPPGVPPRQYVPYGNDDFAFYGRAYGRPYDPWTWTYLSGGYYNAIARYYYPPL